MPGWFAPLVADLKATRGRSFIHAGPDQPASVHALVHAMNEALGGRGQTYDLIAPVEADPVDHAASLRGLIDDMNAGRVTTLVIIDSNPVFTAPGFAEAADARRGLDDIGRRPHRDRRQDHLEPSRSAWFRGLE